MKFLIVIICFFCAQSSWGQWQPFATLGTSNLNDVFFLDSSKGFICASDRGYKSSNGGLTWQLDMMMGGRSIHFTDTLVGYIAGGGSSASIRRTVNGGVSWSILFLPSGTSPLYDIDFDSAGIHGIAVGNNGCLLRTSDSGLTWTLAAMPTTNHLKGVKYLGNNQFMVIGEFVCYRSFNNGLSWSVVTLPHNAQYQSISFASNLVGYITGYALPSSSGDYYLFQTRDGGFTWTVEERHVIYSTNHPLSSPVVGLDSLVFFRALDNHIRVRGHSYLPEYIVNRGPANFTNKINNIFMFNKLDGWAVANSGVLLRYKQDFELSVIDTARCVGDSLTVVVPAPYDTGHTFLWTWTGVNSNNVTVSQTLTSSSPILGIRMARSGGQISVQVLTSNGEIFYGNNHLMVSFTSTGAANLRITPDNGTEVTRCVGDNFTYSYNNVPSYTYRWYTPRGSFVPTNSSLSTPNLDTTDNGFYTLQVNSGFCPYFRQFKLNVVERFQQPTVSSNSPICQGQTLILTASSSDSSVSYRWLFPNGTTASGSVVGTLNTVSGSQQVYRCQVGIDGCQSDYSTVFVNVNSLPPVPNFIGVSSACHNDSVIWVVNGSGSGATYLWTFADGSTTTSSLINPSTNFVGMSTYNVRAISQQACTSAVLTRGLTIHPIPTPPQITLLNNTTLTTQEIGAIHEWYQNGVQIQGNTTATFSPTATDSVRVRINRNGCWSSFSESYFFEMLTYNQQHDSPKSINFVIDNQQIALISSQDLTGKTLLITDILGRNWIRAKVDSNPFVIAVGHLALRAIYVVSIVDENGENLYNHKIWLE